MRAEEKTRAGLNKTIASLRVIAPKLDEFARERALLDEKAALVRRVLPATVNASEYVTQLRSVCAGFGVGITGWTARESAEGRLRTGTIELTLAGSLQDLDALGRRIETMARLADWKLIGTDGARGTAQVRIYALPERPAGRPVDWCSPGRRRVWLWPFRGWLEDARNARAAPCQELADLRPVRVQVDAYERDRQEFTEMVEAIERLRADRAPDEILPPDALKPALQSP